MAISGLEDGARLIVGSKQTRLALERGKALKVFIAQDADPKLMEPIVRLCEDRGIALHTVASMRELGAACGIQVGASAAAMVLK